MLPNEREALEHFLFTLEWLLAVTARYPGSDVQIGLIHVDFGDPRILGEFYGAQRASQRLQEVTRCLRSAFRKTDLVARDGEDFWILTPYTPVTDKLSDKAMHITRIASKNGLEFVERDISIFSLTDVVALSKDRNASQFLLHLKQHHIPLARSERILPAAD
jgi:GGDEF domain-containing protein